MTVYRYFIRIALRNKWAILTYTAVFFIFAMINSSNPKIEDVGFTDVELNLGIVDKSKSQLSHSFIEYLERKNTTMDLHDDIEFIKEQVFLGIVDAAIIIPEDFRDRVVGRGYAVEVYKDDRRIETIQVDNQITKYLAFLNASYEEGEFDLPAIDRALNEKIHLELIGDGNELKNQGGKEWFRYYSNFTGYVIMAVYIAVMGLVMADFTDYNVDNRRRISSKKAIQYNREIYLGQLSLASIITLVFILGAIILGSRQGTGLNYNIYIINIIVFSFSILCLTFLINNITRNRFVINGISTVLSLGTSFISGVMVPQQILGEKVLTLAKFFPIYYFVKINDMQTNAVGDIRYEILMQLLFGLAFLSIGLYFFKSKQSV